MTYPARREFNRDRRIKERHWLTFAYLEDHLDFLEVRAVKRWAVSHSTGVKEPHVSTVLSDLVAWGYLTEHARDGQVRCFTLCYSRRGTGAVPVPDAAAA